MRRGLGALAAALGLLASAPVASAATFTVSADGDSGAGTLRQALLDAAAAAGADTVAFAGGVGPITLASTLDVSSPVAIADAEGDVEVRSTTATPLLRFGPGASGSSLRGVRLRSDDGTLVEVAPGAQGVTLRAAPLLAGPVPITLAPGANGGTSPPQGLRVSRDASGTLLISGTAQAAGTVDLYRGSPAAAAGSAFAAELGVPAGPFAVALPFTPAAGEVLGATLTSSLGTSNLVTLTVPSDLTAPLALGATAIGQSEVRVQLSEPIDPASLAPDDFALSMAGRDRAITAVTPLPGGASVVLTSSSPWRAGEAGFVQLRGPGVVADLAGNQSARTDLLRVSASPGDVVEPFASSLSVRPRAVCLTRGPRCRRPGALVRFVASEESRVTFVLMRGNRRVGVRKYDAEVGLNRIRYDGRASGKKLRESTYRLLVYLEDDVGNETVDPPLQRFSVRRTAPPAAARTPVTRR